MPVISPQFIFDLESRMRRVQVNLYAALMASENQWWDLVTKRITTGARKDVITWILETARLQSTGRKGGNIAFDDLVMLEYDYEVESAAKGLRIQRPQFEDLDGNGVQMATSWIRQITAQAAYWPQRSIVQLMKDGQTGTAYDTKAFFAADHPNNPYDAAAGVYSNLFTSKRIDKGVALDVALGNLDDIFAEIRSIKMPNGQDPRFLKPKGLIVPPAMYARACQLTDAKFLAMAATGGAGATDVEGYLRALGYAKPVQAPEFAGWGDNKSFFVVAEQAEADELGAMIFADREPFSVRYYTGRGGGTGVDAILDRSELLEWHCSGRNVGTYGHPYLLFCVDNT